MKLTFLPRRAALLQPCRGLRAHCVFPVLLPLHPMKAHTRLCKGILGLQCSALLEQSLLYSGAGLLSGVFTRVCLASITAELIATSMNYMFSAEGGCCRDS